MSEPDKSPEKATPFSIRLTDSEKELLLGKAGKTPLGTFIREAILGASPRPLRQNPVKDGEPLGRILGLLGQSRMASNLNQIAKAANQGSLPVTKELEEDLHRACAEVFEMRLLLLQALGIRILDEVQRTPLPMVDFFNEAAGGTAE
jgi:hypothetical protein